MSKRINTNAKGRRNEKKTEAWLEQHGFLVETTKRSSYRGQSNDFFNKWDHIAVYNGQWIVGKWTHSFPDSESFVNFGDTLYVQTKSNRMPPKEYLKELSGFPALNKLLVIWKDDVKEPVVIRL